MSAGLVDVGTCGENYWREGECGNPIAYYVEYTGSGTLARRGPGLACATETCKECAGRLRMGEPIDPEYEHMDGTPVVLLIRDVESHNRYYRLACEAGLQVEWAADSAQVVDALAAAVSGEQTQ